MSVAGDVLNEFLARALAERHRLIEESLRNFLIPLNWHQRGRVLIEDHTLYEDSTYVFRVQEPEDMTLHDLGLWFTRTTALRQLAPELP